MTGHARAPDLTGPSVPSRGAGAGFGPALALGVMGLLFLMALRLAPSKDDAVAALIYPPWVPAQELSADLAALDLPMRDFRWNGRLIALDLSQAPIATRAQLNSWRVGRALRVSGSFEPPCGATRTP